MSRYRALRHMGVDPIAACVVAGLNAFFETPPGVIIFMSIVIEYDPAS